MLHAVVDHRPRIGRAKDLAAALALIAAILAGLVTAAAEAVPLGAPTRLGNPGASPAIAYNPATGRGLAVWTGPHEEATGV